MDIKERTVSGYRFSVSANRSPLTAAFTLIELVITIAISTMITAALYFSLKTALGTWQACQDDLLLQQVSSRIMEELVEGLPDEYGLRDALEVIEGAPTQAITVMPWTDNTHDVYSGINTYTLNKHIKPGTNLPFAEALLPESKKYRVVPITMLDEGKSDDYPHIGLNMSLPAGSRLRFSFYPDYKKDADVLTTFRFDEGEQAIFIDDKDGSRQAYKNPFGVKITDFRMRYFDNANNELGLNGVLPAEGIPVITGIEIAFKALGKNGASRETVTFVSLRNAPMRSGNLTLREGLKFPIPNSMQVKALFLTNLAGIDNKDSLVLEAKPENGRSWLLRIQFSKLSNSSKPLIESYSIECPPGNTVFSDTPKLPANLGLNLLALGPNGLYDYGYNGIPDEVILEGRVNLGVKKMDIGGASIFIRP